MALENCGMGQVLFWGACHLAVLPLWHGSDHVSPLSLLAKCCSFSLPKIPKQQSPPRKGNVAAAMGSKSGTNPPHGFFVFHKLFASWLWHRMWTSLANICTNFMLIKIRLLRQAWLLSHSYDYCLDLWYYKRKGKACSCRVMVVNFSREGFSLQFFSINDCCMNGLQGLLEDSVDPLGNPCHNTDAGFFSPLFKWLKKLLDISRWFLPPTKVHWNSR